MNRRFFLTTTAALLPASLSLYFFGTSEVEAATALKHRIISSFGTQLGDIDLKTNTYAMCNMLQIRKDDSNFSEFSFHARNYTADLHENYNLDDVFVDAIEEKNYTDYDRTGMATPDALEVSSIVQAGNNIARKTRIGMGKQYAVFPDHILVWYKGRNAADTPVTRMGKNIAINSNFENYFFKVKGITLRDKDHARLKEIGFVRIT